MAAGRLRRIARVRRSIRARILAAFVLSLAAMAGALGYGLVQLRHTGEALVAVDTGWLPLATVANELEAVVRLMDREHDRLAREGGRPMAGHRSNAALYGASLADAVERGRATARRALERIADEEERRAFRGALEVLDEIDHLRVRYVDAFRAWTTDPDAAGLAELDGERTELVLQVGLLRALVEGRVELVAARTARTQARATAVSGALAALAVALAGAMAAVALVTLRPIERLTEQVQRLGAGDYAGRVEVSSHDEVGVLAREFNAMAAAVAERDRRLVERAAALEALSERLRLVLDTIRAGLAVVEDGRCAVVNPAARALWGVEPGDPLPSPLDALGPGRHEAVPFRGRLLDVEVAPFGERGRLVVAEDATERIRDRERLARSERLALVGQMLAQITHEVRNPLNAISLHAELLAEDVDDPGARELLETLTREIRRLEQLTQRYLELSRGRRPELVPADPLEVAREVLAFEAPALDREGVRVEVADEGAPGVVEIDADALRRALRNLVRNAVEAGARRVRVAVRGGDGEVEVRVEDDGPGLSPEQAARVFEPFFTTKARGTGLGLAITRQELEDVGGRIRCELRPEGGCAFVLALPAGGDWTEGGGRDNLPRSREEA